MAILEAMYYGCKVVAWKAPGPSFIIEDGISGYLVDSNEMLCGKIQDSKYNSENGKERVLSQFTWDTMAKSMMRYIKQGEEYAGS